MDSLLVLGRISLVFQEVVGPVGRGAVRPRFCRLLVSTRGATNPNGGLS